MPVSEAQKRASMKWRAANLSKVNAYRRELFAKQYLEDADKFKKISVIAYQKRRVEKIAHDLGKYYYRKQWKILCSIDLFD